MTWIMIAGGISLCFLYFCFVARKMLKLRAIRREAWSRIDEHLRRRYDLIPDVLEEARNYTKHKDDLFSKIKAARTECFIAEKIPEKAAAENKLVQELDTLFTAVEHHPDLKNGRDFIELKNDLCDIEDRLRYTRGYFNGITKKFNVLVESFPSAFVAKAFNFRSADYFELPELCKAEKDKVKNK